MVKKLVLLSVLATFVAGCNLNNPLVRTGVGAGAGAGIAAASGGDPLTGGLVGGAAGAISCLVPGTAGCK